MGECPECGSEIRDGDAVVEVAGQTYHAACVEAPVDHEANDELDRERRHAETLRQGPRAQRRGIF